MAGYEKNLVVAASTVEKICGRTSAIGASSSASQKIGGTSTPKARDGSQSPMRDATAAAATAAAAAKAAGEVP